MVCRSSDNNIADTQLYLQIVCSCMMIVSEEHQAMIGDNICFICMAREHHLSTNGLVGGCDDFFPILVDKQLAVLTADVVRPENQPDRLTFETLFTEAFAEII